MQLFLNRLHDEFPNDILVVVCDGATWHKSSKLEVPENMTILHIPPYTPEMNPIEQIWREPRTQGFRNEVFATLEKVVNRLCETIRHLSKNTIISITRRQWMWCIFRITTLIISKKPGNTGISRDIRTEFTTDLLLSD